MLLLQLKMHAQDAWIKAPYRPQVHFTPKEHWMNDPNGMVYYKGVYHLFYQYYPGASVWGPMHWGHATSKDLVHWQHQPVALFPDSLGYIFSGSAVVDSLNTSGFGKKGKIPLVAIFTHHDPKGEKAGKNNFQYQSLAYSLDEGKTWKKYAGNPVLPNPGIVDFRDPKVRWYAPQKKWIMTLATKDRVTFYSSKNLKQWTKESEFGENQGAHGGVWECPDLFPMTCNGETIWVLLVNLNPGGPNKGSATQYFTGDFDGKNFIAHTAQSRWLDNGPDEYAGITWSNTGDRTLFIGWMSNWQYAQVVPTNTWRSAFTIVRELTLKQTKEGYQVASMPVTELSSIATNPISIKKVNAHSFAIDTATGTALVRIKCNKPEDFNFVLFNALGEKITGGYDPETVHFFLDRSKSGKIDFEKGFGERHEAPRFARTASMDITMVIDKTSIELFADDGLSVMTQTFYPNQPFSELRIMASYEGTIESIDFAALRSIWIK